MGRGSRASPGRTPATTVTRMRSARTRIIVILDLLTLTQDDRSRSPSRSPSRSVSRSRSEDSQDDQEEEESDWEPEDTAGDIPVKQPSILVFDSLGGRRDRQARLCAVLRDFLAKEYEEKYPGQTREFSPRTMPGCAPK